MGTVNDRVPVSSTGHSEALVARFKSRSATIGVIGLGYVGLPLVCRFAEAGFQTIGFDIDPVKVAALREGKTYLRPLRPTRFRRRSRQD